MKTLTSEQWLYIGLLIDDQLCDLRDVIDSGGPEDMRIKAEAEVQRVLDIDKVVNQNI